MTTDRDTKNKIEKKIKENEAYHLNESVKKLEHKNKYIPSLFKKDDVLIDFIGNIEKRVVKLESKLEKNTDTVYQFEVHGHNEFIEIKLMEKTYK